MAENARIARIAFAFQWFAACSMLTAWQHLAFGAGLTGPAQTATTLVWSLAVATRLMAVRTADSCK